VLKILFTVAVIAGVWYLFKDRDGGAAKSSGNSFGGGIGRFGRALSAAGRAMADSAKDRQAGPGRPVEREPAAARAEPPVAQGQALELRPCPRCGTYVAVGTACTCAGK